MGVINLTPMMPSGLTTIRGLTTRHHRGLLKPPHFTTIHGTEGLKGERVGGNNARRFNPLRLKKIVKK